MLIQKRPLSRQPPLETRGSRQVNIPSKDHGHTGPDMRDGCNYRCTCAEVWYQPTSSTSLSVYM